ncbi:MAG: signal peptide peptidase SppA [Candidatus Paracaedibacter sp.]
MRRFIVGTLAIIGAITLFLLLSLGWSLYRLSSPSLSAASSESPVVLKLTLGNQKLPEQPHSKGLMSLIEGTPLSVYSIITALNHAATDKNVKGILLTIEGNALNIATIQEIREALKAFKATGKFIYTYTDTFGEMSNGTKNYYLASASSKIWMMPMGTLNLIGISLEVPFAKKALEDFKIRPQVGRREEYKSMPESATEADFSAPYRENTQRILDTLISQIVTDIAADRSLTAEEVRNVLNTAPHLPEKAIATKMVDELGYMDQAKDAIEKLTDKKPNYVPFDSYAHALNSPSKGKKIAIIYAEGTIAKGKAQWNPLSDEFAMDAVEIAKSIRNAAEDSSISAIILRVDSGGGNPIASELIGREMDRAKAKKPTIASLSNYAASGGYWIVCNAHKIVAQPSSLTGSIGVFAGKFVTEGFWENYGVHWGEIHNGDNSAIWSTGQNYSENGRKKLEEYLDQIYGIFLKKVAAGRNLPLEKVRLIAKGQVWNGVEAKEKGLVDVLGGLNTAIEIAKKEAGLADDALVTIVHFPVEKTLLAMLLDRGREAEAHALTRYPTFRQALQKLDGIFAKPQIELKMNDKILETVNQ